MQEFLIKSVFKDNEEISIEKKIVVTGDGMKKTVVDNNNGYTKVKYFGDVTTIEIIDVFKSIAGEEYVDNVESTSLMQNKKNGVNALLRGKYGGIIEARIIQIFDTTTKEWKDAINKSHREQKEIIERGGGVLAHWARTK